MSIRSLPPVPNLEQQKKQARELLKAVRARDPEALRRFREHHPRFQPGAVFSLHDAQLVLAHEYGFASWPKLKTHINDVLAARHTRPFVRDIKFYEERAQGLMEVHAGGLPDALVQIRSWHPEYAGASDDKIRGARFTLDDAQLVYAREHGFTSWEKFSAHLKTLSEGKAQEPFMDAFEAIEHGDAKRLQSLLRGHRDLNNARGTNGNTLLNLAGSLAYKKKNDAGDPLVMVKLLLEAGAEPNIVNDRGWSPLHQACYSNQSDLAKLLLAAGAAVDGSAHGTGGTPLVVALFWGHREAAEVVAEVAIVPNNLRVASGLGRKELVQKFFLADGSLTTAAGQNRGFYRPHSGFPVWHPSSHKQEILDEALVWAAKSDRVEVMPILVKHGAMVSADPYRGTPLLWAAAAGRSNAVHWLLDHGADVNQRATFGGPGHGQGVTALHLAVQNKNLTMVKLLLARGADATIKEDLYHGSPRDWAEHFGAEEVLKQLPG